MNRKPVKGVIFDLDGLLLDTEPLYQIANSKVCEEYGQTYTTDIQLQVIGKAESLGAQAIIDGLQLPLTPKEMLNKRDFHLESLFLSTKPMAGAVKLTTHLAEHKIPIAVATSSHSQSVKWKLNPHKKWFRIFGYDETVWTTLDPESRIISGDNPSIKLAKPSPDIFLLAASRLGLDPSECLVFEDSISGLSAGKAANMQVVSVPDPTIFKNNPQGYIPADLIIHNLEEFIPTSFNLPPYQN